MITFRLPFEGDPSMMQEFRGTRYYCHMRNHKSQAAALVFAVGIFIAERGIDISGIENTHLAYALWSASGLLILVALALFVRGYFRGRVAEPKQIHTADHNRTSGQAQSAQELSGSLVIGDVVGRDKYVYGSDPEQLPKWTMRPGGPEFQFMFASTSEQIEVSFKVMADEMPANFEVRWIGAGIDTDWITPEPNSLRRAERGRTFHAPPISISKDREYDVVTFEARFHLNDGQHGGRWRWPLRRHSKGHWDLMPGSGSGVYQPEEIW